MRCDSVMVMVYISAVCISTVIGALAFTGCVWLAVKVLQAMGVL